MTKEQELENRKKLHEILDIVLDTNSLYSRQRAETGTLPTVFMYFSGHVSQINIDVYPDGWGTDSTGVGSDFKKSFSVYVDEPIKEDFISSLKSYCQHTLNEKKESEVLQRDIIEQEETIKTEKEKLTSMKRKLRKALKRESQEVTA
ncbi:hypothetical protein ACTNEN_09730 [Oribacterium sp. HCP28S3_H8]|uniref:hypothetical protein n=1 Tax=Oribacterium sp. HCP28S3_H8 TaxID=3438945 RepID=UPI003F894DBF